MSFITVRAISKIIISAAVVRHYDPVTLFFISRVAVDMNVLGVRRALDVSKQLPHVEVRLRVWFFVVAGKKIDEDSGHHSFHTCVDLWTE